MNALRTRPALLVSMAALVTLATGCAAPQPAPSSEPQKAPGMQAEKGGILVGPSGRMPSCLYFLAESCIIGGLKTTVLPIWEGIVDFEYIEPGLQTQGVGKFAPRLAESWKQVDPKTWEFTLRKGVKWHDGKDFGADDVLWSLERWKDGVSNSSVRTTAEAFDKVESSGPYNVRITLKAPSPYFLDSITYIEPRILPAHIAKQAGNPTGDALIKLYDANPIGTGPFKFRSFNRTAESQIERFDGYWGEGPYLDGIRVILLRDASTWMAAYGSSKIDFITLGDKVQKETLLPAAPKSTVITYLNDGTHGIVFNLNNPPWNDVRVRRAVHLALDREPIRQTVTAGEGKAGFGPVPAVSTEAGIGVPFEEFMKLPGYRQPKIQDLADAKKLLAEAGIPSRHRVVIKYDRGTQTASTLAEPIASLLRDSLGWEVNLQPLEPATFLAEVEVEKKFDLVVGGFGQHNGLANSIAGTFHSKGPNNYSGVKDAEMDKLIDAAQLEMDDKKRSQLIAQIQRHFNDRAYAVPVPTLVRYMMWHPWLHNFYGSLSSNPSLFNSNVYWMEQGKLPADRRSW